MSFSGTVFWYKKKSNSVAELSTQGGKVKSYGLICWRSLGILTIKNIYYEAFYIFS